MSVVVFVVHDPVMLSMFAVMVAAIITLTADRTMGSSGLSSTTAVCTKI